MQALVTVTTGFVFAVLFLGVAAAQNPEKGKETYVKFCATCHGEKGKGDGPGAAALDPKPRDLSDKAYMTKVSDKDLFKVISGGGVAVGKSPMMPPWGATLTEEDISNVIGYVRTLSK